MAFVLVRKASSHPVPPPSPTQSHRVALGTADQRCFRLCAHQAALRLSLTRALVRSAAIIQRSAMLRTGNMTISEIFDMAMKEAEDEVQGAAQAKVAAKQPIPLRWLPSEWRPSAIPDRSPLRSDCGPLRSRSLRTERRARALVPPSA